MTINFKFYFYKSYIVVCSSMYTVQLFAMIQERLATYWLLAPVEDKHVDSVHGFPIFSV